MDMALFGALVSALAALFALWWSFRSTRAAEHSAEQAMAAGAFSAMREFLLYEYLERKFKATQAPEINGKKVELLREAKTIAMDEHRKSPEEWNKASRLSNSGAWQNQVAYETAWALEHLGASVFAGILPLRMILAIVGDTIIDDWLLCRSWVKSYREVKNLVSKLETKNFPNAHFHRRHAEWLVLVTVLWMERHWSYPNCDCVAEWYGGMQSLQARIQALSCADEALMPQVVRNDVRALTGVKVSPRMTRIGRNQTRTSLLSRHQGAKKEK